ncbi:chloramphenicol-sensitive protein RarD [Nakamurella sp. UYEF19]|uniref:EamA family transporter RarD n=1 Tax=Nakamurella sp. UYEF19 TaxID=1756392 RepID=UPI00339B3D65
MRRGILFGIAAYGFWGLFPLFWPLLEPADAGEILAHRVVWSLLVMGVVVTALRQWRMIISMTGRTWGLVIAASMAISVNWGVYIYAVNSGHVVEAALGYFINPLFSVLLGVVVFHERLRALQWAAVVVGTCAVLVISIAGGRFPWIAVILAGSFGLYGLIKKVVRLPPTASLTAEGMVLLLPALGFLLFLSIHGGSTLTGHGVGHVLLLAASGVITVGPLLAFAAAARALPLSILGLLQYLTPVVQFLIGVVLLHEQMSGARWIGFVLVWAALLLLSVGGIREARRTGRREKSLQPLPS